MPELLTPGVYIQEVDFGPNPIEGVSTSTAGFVGEAERGPTTGSPVLVTSFADFQRTFGGYVKGKALAYAVRGFFENGGKRAYVMRVATTSSSASKTLLSKGYQVRLTSARAVSGSGPYTVSFSLSSVVAVGSYVVLVRIRDKASALVTVSTVNARTGVVTGTTSDTTLAGATAATHYAVVAPIEPITTITAVGSPTVTAFDLTLPAAPGISTGSTLTLVKKSDQTTQTLTVVSVAGNVVRVGPTPDLSSITASAYYVLIAAGATVGVIRARDPGAFGNRLAVLVDAHYPNDTQVIGQAGSSSQYSLQSVDFLSVGSQVQLERQSAGPSTTREVATISAIDPSTGIVTFAQAPSVDYSGARLFLIAWRATVLLDGVVQETISGLSSVLDGSGVASTLESALASQSQWIRAGSGTMKLDAQHGAFPTFDLGTWSLLGGATTPDPDAGVDDVIGTDSPPTGLKAIEAQKGISIILAPGYPSGGVDGTSQPWDLVVSELIAQAERRMDRFAIFEAVSSADANTLLSERGKYNSRYAAMYAPWVSVSDPLTKTIIDMAPSGHIAGAYARTDNDRGVYKSPANVVLRGISGFSRDIPDGEQDVLNPAGINVLRNYDGLGNVIWGARTISAEGLWKYVSVRRLFIFLEQSIITGTRYAVFEPNDLRLWARLRDSLINFLTSQWRAGALFGATPEEAFFVRVDETTTTQDDRDNGRVNILVGIAPVKPAEFIVFQIGQAPQSVIIAEQQGS